MQKPPHVSGERMVQRHAPGIAGTAAEANPKGKNEAGVARKGFSDFSCALEAGTVGQNGMEGRNCLITQELFVPAFVPRIAAWDRS